MAPELKPFLHLPFKDQPYHITEGWEYSLEETSIHGYKHHSAVDFALPRSIEVLAPAEGWAISSYYHFPATKDGKPLLYKGKPVGFGIGRFVQIYHPETKLYTQFGHLEKIASEIPFFAPKRRGDLYYATGNKVPPEKLEKYKFAVFVKKGQLIGCVGDSGLTWGYEDYPERPNPNKFPSWDETHVHFEVFIRVGSKRTKEYFDPYDIKGNFEDYPDTSKRGKPLGAHQLWFLDEKGLPEFSQ